MIKYEKNVLLWMFSNDKHKWLNVWTFSVASVYKKKSKF